MRLSWLTRASSPTRALAFVFLFTLFLCVYCQGLAGGFERVAFYYMFRAAYLTYGKDQDKIFPKNANLGVDCSKGSHKQGGCNFIEFCEQLNGRPLDPQHIADSGIDLDNPDPIKAANMLNRNKVHTNLVKLPRLHTGCANVGPDYARCVKYVFQEYKRLHIKKAEEGNHKQLVPFDQQVRKSIEHIVNIRQGETIRPWMLDEFKAKFGVDLEADVKDYPHDEETRPEKRKKQVTVKIEETIKKNGDKLGFKNAVAKTKAVKSWVQNYGKKSDSSASSKTHYKVMYAWDSQKGDLNKWCGGKPAS